MVDTDSDSILTWDEITACVMRFPRLTRMPLLTWSAPLPLLMKAVSSVRGAVPGTCATGETWRASIERSQSDRNTSGGLGY